MFERRHFQHLLARLVQRYDTRRPAVLRLEALEDRIVPTLLGQQLFPSDSPWNQLVTNAPVAANSAAVLNNVINNYTDGRLHPDFGQAYHAGNRLYGIPSNVAHGNSTAKTSVVLDAYANESDALAAPIPANPVIEGDFDNGPNHTLGYGPGGRGDSHLLVYDVDNNVAYEFFKASRPSENPDGKWHADQETVWDYKTNAFRTLGATSADAAGLSILAGLVRPDEALPVSQGGQGAIKHAIRFTLENDLILNEFLYPASHNANPGNTNASVQVPIGARFRLKAGVDLSQLDPQSRVVAQAMKDYGLILADNGSNFFFSGASYAVNGSNAQTLTWDDEDVQDTTHGLKSLHYSDFELLDLTPVVTGLSTASGAAGTSVTVTGKNFSGAAGHLQVLFGSAAATSVTVTDDSHVVAVAPAGSGTVDVRVRSGVVPGTDGSNFTSPVFGYGTSAVTAADRFGYGSTPGNQPPTVAQAASAPATVTGKTTGLSVLGADDGGESNLSYAWAASGPAAVSFSANGTNAVKNVTATFAKAGQYAFVVTITDAGGLSVTSGVSVTVAQTLTSITVTPGTATVAPGQRQQFTPTAKDQFGAALSTQPSFAWAAGGGTIDGSGLFTAGAAPGDPFTVTASKGGVSGAASVTVSSPPPRKHVIVLGTDAGTETRVRILDAATRGVIRAFSPFPGFAGGVSVAAGDVTGDGVPDVIAGTGSGGSSRVSVFDGSTGATLISFLAFEGFNGPVSVALGDVTGDGRADLIVGAPVNGHVKAFDGATGATFRSFLAFAGFGGSVAVGAGDLDGDGRAELLVGASLNGHVKAFGALDNSLVQSFLAYAGFSGSTTVAGGDLDGDGRAEILTGAGAAATHVKAFDSVSRAEKASFIAFPGAPYGVRVGTADANGDGKDDVLAAPGGPVPQVKIFDGATLQPIDSFFALAATAGVGVFLGGSL